MALAEDVYIALCETLLALRPEDGVALWRSLQGLVQTRYLGQAGIDEFLHMVFRAPDSPEVEALREEILRLDQRYSDKALFDVALVSTLNGHADWLQRVLAEDLRSDLVWRQRRGVTLQGFVSPNEMPVEGAWPEGEASSGMEGARRAAARSRHLDACAQHWWSAYLAARTPEEAFAAWTLLVQSADRRTWVWMRTMLESVSNRDVFFEQKLAHVRLNLRELRSAADKKEKDWAKSFLGRKHIEGVGPWSRSIERS